MAVVTLGNKSVGSIVNLKENGVSQDFYVAQQGYPTAGNGRTLLVRRFVFDYRQWHSSGVNAYATSSIDSWLNSTYLGLLPTDIQGRIAAVNIPYTPGNGDKTVGTLSRRVFLLSATELGFSTQNANIEGSTLGITNTLVAATTSTGAAANTWTRTPYPFDNTDVFIVATDRGLHATMSQGINASRPAFTLPDALSVTDDGTVIVNTAPTVPDPITVSPSQLITGQPITISWNPATDAEGNLAGYILQRSTNGGASWSQIFQANATSTTDTLPTGTTQVRYRVAAFDVYSAQSAWTTGANLPVISNTPPTVPPSITVPMTPVGGKSLTVSWAASSDAEGNLAGYTLQRSVNNGSDWTTVYEGPLLFFSEVIGFGVGSVTYRVRAFDSFAFVSDWRTSPGRTVDNTPAPTITSSSSGNLGEKSGGFSVSYVVNYTGSDAVTAREAVDGVAKRTYTVTPGANNSFQVTGDFFQQLLNGTRTMTVTATSATGKAASLSWTFTKTVFALSVTLNPPYQTGHLLTQVMMSVTRNIPPGATFQALATNNALDPSPVWEDITADVLANQPHAFANAEATSAPAFNLKVLASRAPGGAGGNISLIAGVIE